MLAALLAAALASPRLRADVDKFDGALARLRADAAHIEPHRSLCRVGDVEVLQRGSTRALRFANEEAAGVEALVECAEAAPCGEDCAPCNCSAKLDTPAQLGTEYHRVIARELAPVCPRPSSRVLLVGLGGGVLAQYLRQHCPNMRVDAYELRADVVAAARKYFGVAAAEARGLRVHVGDGGAALAVLARTDPGGFDAVVVDCFAGAGLIPEACRSLDALEHARALLAPGGRLLQNAWAESPKFPEVARDFAALRADYGRVFGARTGDLRVPMPADVDFVRILTGTK